MPDRIQTLRALLDAYLDDEIRKKSAEDLTGREKAILETAEALMALLLRQQRNRVSSSSFDATVANLMHSYRQVAEDDDVMSLVED